jgi:hypothetical protein
MIVALDGDGMDDILLSGGPEGFGTMGVITSFFEINTEEFPLSAH